MTDGGGGVKKEKILLVILLLVAMPLLTGAVMSINPATEEQELIFIPSVKERNMGRKIHKQIGEHFNLPVDPLMQKRVEELGKKLASGADRRDVVYRFTVLDHEKDDCYNAFAVPGGYIYIFDDLVEVMETDDNVGAILAHEMGHVEARHAVKRMQGSIGTTILMLLGGYMEKKEGAYAKANMAIGQLMAAYSRHDERQADELSVKYMKRAELDPNGSVGALQTLKGLRKKAPRMKYSFYKSHPYISERIAYLKNFIRGYADFDSYINLVTQKHEL
ncbi:M48 family metalloprotease [Candidatus Omnitrophota bacterium]